MKVINKSRRRTQVVEGFCNTPHSSATDIALLILRIVIGTWMLSKGLSKVQMLFSGEVRFYAVMGMSSQVSLALTVFAQVVGSLLIMTGVITRFATVILAVNMLVAVVAVHSNEPFAKAEPALHFLLVYVVLSFTGAGKFSLDHWLVSKPVNPQKPV